MLTNKFTFALEGIAFQPNSKLSQEMIAIFNDLKKFPSTLSTDPGKEFNKYFLETLNYFEKVTAPKLQKCVHMHTGINLHQVVCRDLYPKNEAFYSGFFAMTIGKVNKDMQVVDSPKWWNNIAKVVSGGASKTAHTDVETADQLNNLILKFDDEVGRFQVDTKLDGLINMALIVDLVAICFTEQVLHEKLSSLTSEEVTAVILHEIGHTLGAVSYARFTNYSIEVLRKAFDHFDTYAKVEEKIKFIKTNPNLQPNPNNSKDVNEVLTKVQELTDATTKIPNQNSSAFHTIGAVIYNLFKVKFSISVSRYLLPTLIISRCFAYFIKGLNVINHDKTTKTSDHTNLRLQVIEPERIADEYVAKHNMSSYLATALKKITDNGLYAGGIGPDNKVSKTSSLTFYFITFTTFILELNNDLYWTGIEVHPPYRERIELLILNQMKMIKANIDNPRMAALALTEYEKLKLMVNNKSKLDKIRDLNNKLQGVLDKLISIISIGNLDYSQLVEIENITKSAINLMHSDILASAIKLSIISKEK